MGHRTVRWYICVFLSCEICGRLLWSRKQILSTLANHFTCGFHFCCWKPSVVLRTIIFKVFFLCLPVRSLPLISFSCICMCTLFSCQEVMMKWCWKIWRPDIFKYLLFSSSGIPVWYILNQLTRYFVFLNFTSILLIKDTPKYTFFFTYIFQFIRWLFSGFYSAFFSFSFLEIQWI